ncbi:MAG TPA: flagellar basal body rod protein FlgB [Clostridia bacterium]|nr:flagellar basal body rod protein FlgB [Clostridia bacterium]
MDLTRSSAIDILNTALDGAASRLYLLADNVANVDTPGYKRVDTSFFDIFSAMLRTRPALTLTRTDPRHLPEPRSGSSGPEPRVYTDTSTSQRLDGNNVDIEYEMAKMAETTVLYDLLARELSSRISMLRTAAFEGRR